MGRAHNGALSYLAQPALPWEKIVNAAGGLLGFSFVVPSSTLCIKKEKNNSQTNLLAT